MPKNKTVAQSDTCHDEFTEPPPYCLHELQHLSQIGQENCKL